MAWQAVAAEVGEKLASAIVKSLANKLMAKISSAISKYALNPVEIQRFWNNIDQSDFLVEASLSAIHAVYDDTWAGEDLAGYLHGVAKKSGVNPTATAYMLWGVYEVFGGEKGVRRWKARAEASKKEFEKQKKLTAPKSVSDWLESWEKKILPPPATPYPHAQMTAIADALAFGTPWPENQDYAEAKARYYNQWGKIHAMAAGEEKTGATTVTDNRALDYVVGLIDGARLWNGNTGKAAAQDYIDATTWHSTAKKKTAQSLVDAAPEPLHKTDDAQAGVALLPIAIAAGALILARAN